MTTDDDVLDRLRQKIAKIEAENTMLEEMLALSQKKVRLTAVELRRVQRELARRRGGNGGDDAIDDEPQGDAS